MKDSSFAAALVASVCVVAMAAPACAQTSEYRIPAGSLKSTLDAFARQSGRQIIYKADEIRGVRSPGVEGARTAEAALDALLQGSGFSFRVDPSGAIAIVSGKARAGGAPEEEESADIVVTGTHIAGASAASPVISISRKDIERSGYSNAADLLKNLPQSSPGGQNFTIVGSPNANSAQNLGAISSANLRGLGSDATLTLVDGHRLSYGGLFNGVDISSIPFGAIERVEVLTDGASAIYGSDAVAGVVNFVLRRRFDGFLTTARTGTSTDGGGEEYQVNQLAGTSWSSGSILASFELYHQDPVFASGRSFSRSAAAPLSLLPRQSKRSGFGAFHQEIMPAMSFNVAALYTSRSVHSYISSVTAITNTSSSVRQFGISPELKLQLGDWSAAISADIAQDQEVYDGSSIVKSTGASVPNHVSFDNSLANFEGKVSGNLLKMPGGNLQAAFGGGFRKESLDAFFSSAQQDGSRTIGFGYGELRIPLVSPDNGISGINLLEISAAGRYEHYSDFGSNFSPKAGIAYRPIADLTLRGTWGRSFRAPTLYQFYGIRSTAIYPVATLQVTAPPGSVIISPGGPSRELGPERATSVTAGLDYVPQWLSGAKISASYFNIKYRGRIGPPIGNTVGIFNNPIYAPFIIKNPTPAQIQAVLENSDAITNLAGNYAPAQVVAIYNRVNMNLFSQRISGFDITASYAFQLGRTNINIFGNASYLNLKQQTLPTLPEVTLSGTVFYPSKFRARGGVQVQGPIIGASLTVNHIGSEIDNSGIANPSSPAINVPVSPQTTLDAQLVFGSTEPDSALGGFQLTFSVQNLLNTAPPLIGSRSTVASYPGLNYDSANYSAVGRYLSVTASMRW